MQSERAAGYDAILIVGFGGPERREDVLPFLENVTRGRNVPRDRLLEVAEHYDHFGGVSPINAQVRALIDALRIELDRAGLVAADLLGQSQLAPDAGRHGRGDGARGVKKALALVLAAYGSYSSCRQYREDIARAQAAVGPAAPRIDKVTALLQSSRFRGRQRRSRSRRSRQASAADARDAVRAGLHGPQHSASRWRETATTSISFGETCRLVAEQARHPSETVAIWSTRAGAGGRAIPGSSRTSSITCGTSKTRGCRHRRDPSDRVPVRSHGGALRPGRGGEAACANSSALTMVRAQTVGIASRFVSMLGDLIAERLEERARSSRRGVGETGRAATGARIRAVWLLRRQRVPADLRAFGQFAGRGGRRGVAGDVGVNAAGQQRR